MKPDKDYIKLQTELTHLIEQGDQSGQRRGLERELEKRFMVAWSLTRDRLRLAGKLKE
jgi:hypothetical protein